MTERDLGMLILGSTTMISGMAGFGDRAGSGVRSVQGAVATWSVVADPPATAGGTDRQRLRLSIHFLVYRPYRQKLCCDQCPARTQLHHPLRDEAAKALMFFDDPEAERAVGELYQDGEERARLMKEAKEQGPSEFLRH